MIRAAPDHAVEAKNRRFSQVSRIPATALDLLWARLYVLPHARGGVAQLVRALPCHGRGRGFESRRSRFRQPQPSNGLEVRSELIAWPYLDDPAGLREDLAGPAAQSETILYRPLRRSYA